MARHILKKKTVKKDQDKNKKKKNAKRTRDKNNRCEYCGWRTSWLSALKVHIKIKHFGGQLFKCGHCNETFTLEGNGRRHSANKHPNLDVLITLVDASPNEPAANEEQLQCVITDVQAEQIVPVIQDQEQQTLFFVPCNSGESVDDSLLEVFQEVISLENDYNIFTENAHVQNVDCQQCTYVGNIAEYTQHLRNTHIQSVSCPYCAVACDGPDGLSIHLQTVHITWQSCPICKEATYGFLNLEIHMKNNHMNQYVNL